jgi:hypothetical protein
MFWRGLLGGFLLGAVAGVVVGLIAGFVGAFVFHVPYDVATYQRIGRLSSLSVCMPLGIVWGFLIFQMAFLKKYRDFRIVLVPADCQLQASVPVTLGIQSWGAATRAAAGGRDFTHGFGAS